jgi:hypothetical protein
MENYNIVSAEDGQTVIGTCDYDEAKHKVGNIKMKPTSEELEFMDLSNVNPYDNDIAYRCGRYLCLRHYIGFGSQKYAVSYDIELSRLDTPEKVYQWLVHLLAKTWVTREMLYRMVCILEAHFNYDLHRFIEAAC